MSQSGILYDWNRFKACGWVRGPDEQTYFAHKSEFIEQFGDSSGPPVGCEVLFEIGADQKSGKERATQIQVVDGMGGTEGDVVHGVIVDWLPNKACGWVEPMDAALGKKMFTHKSEFKVQFDDNRPPIAGSRVSFIIGVDQKSGKERAQQVEILDAPARGPAVGSIAERYNSLKKRKNDSGVRPGMKAAQHQMAAQHHSDPGTLSGVIASWDLAKGCGWLESQMAPGHRLFAHKSEFVQPFADGQAPLPGTQVSFQVGIDQKSGKERAVSIQLAFDGRAMMQPFSQAVMGRRLASGSQSPSSMAQPGTGTITAWNAEKGCGWIEGQGHQGSNYFAHKSEFVEPFADDEEPPIGRNVRFTIGVDKRSGKKRAQQISFSNGLFAQSGKTPTEPTSSGLMIGTIVEWNIEKGFGYLESDRIPGKKLFTHKTEFAEASDDNDWQPGLGTVVSFKLGRDARSGKERACEIHIGEVDEPRVSGVLKTWNLGKACGWIQVEDRTKEVFAHKSEFVDAFDDANPPAEGTSVSFILAVDSKSRKERAADIVVLDHFAEPRSKRTRIS